MRARTRICARNPDDFVLGRKPIDFVSQSISQASGNPHDGPKNSYGAFWGEFRPSQDKLSFSFFLSRHGPVFRMASRNPADLVFRNPADLASARESERTPSGAGNPESGKIPDQAGERLQRCLYGSRWGVMASFRPKTGTISPFARI